MPVVKVVSSSSSSESSDDERDRRHHKHHSRKRSSSRQDRPKPQRHAHSNFAPAFQGEHPPYGLDPYNYGGLYRARSVGHGRAPELHVHMDQVNRNESRSPEERHRGRKKKHHKNSSDDEIVIPDAPMVPGVPMPPGALPGFGAPGHGHHGRHPSRDPSPYYHEAKYQQMLQKEEAEEREREKERAIADHVRAEEEKEKEHKMMLEKWEAEQKARKKEEEEEEKRIVERYEQKQKDKKEKEKKEWEEFEMKRKLKLEEEEKKKKKEEEEYKERLYKDFSKFGFSNNQIEHMVNYDEKKKKEELTTTHRSSKHRSSRELTVARPKSGSFVGRPVYPKIRRVDIDMETLKYYNLPWEYEFGSNDEFIIILQEMSVKDTDTLFEHTRRLRSRKTLTLEDRGTKDKPEYAWVRRRSRSKSVSGKDRGKSPRREKVAETILKGGN